MPAPSRRIYATAIVAVLMGTVPGVTSAHAASLLAPATSRASATTASTGHLSASAQARTSTPTRNGDIAFVRNNQIYRSHKDGTHVRKLTRGEKNYWPTFSPDGHKIAYVHEEAGARDIWVMKTNGDKPHALTSTGDATGPGWSPNGRWVALGSPDGWGELRRVKVAAPHTVTTIDALDPGCSETEPSPQSAIGRVAYSPDGLWIAYTSGDGCDSPDFFFNLLNRTTGEIDTLYGIGGECCGFGYIRNPSFAPDSARLAYDYAINPHPFEPLQPRLDVDAVQGAARSGTSKDAVTSSRTTPRTERG